MNQFVRYGLILLLMGAGAGCGSTTDDATEPGTTQSQDASIGSQADTGRLPDATPRVIPDAGPPASTATVTGRVVNEDGEPLFDIRVLCCSHSVCYQDPTDEDGRYEITNIDPDDVYKMQTTDPMKVYSSLYFYQATVSDEVTNLSREVILPRRVTDIVAWDVADGGVIVLAGGELELMATPGTLEFPVGLDEALMADVIPGTILPPYRSTPWAVDADALLVYTFNPVPIKASEPIGLTINRDGLGAPGTQWNVYSVNLENADIDGVGTATVSMDGQLISDPGGTLKNLGTIILEPSSE